MTSKSLNPSLSRHVTHVNQVMVAIYVRGQTFDIGKMSMANAEAGSWRYQDVTLQLVYLSGRRSLQGSSMTPLTS
jgi:hypothetical protein